MTSISDHQAIEGPPEIILASGSVGRKALLIRLFERFTCQAADINEKSLPGEAPIALAGRLAQEKAKAVAATVDRQAIVIGADQVAVCRGEILGKPGNARKNQEQLTFLSGQIAHFYSAVYIIDQRTNRVFQHIDDTCARFRALSPEEIERYIHLDEPWHCAGGFKVESKGITLFDQISSQDPTGLIGLPLIFVASALRDCGINL